MSCCGFGSLRAKLNPPQCFSDNGSLIQIHFAFPVRFLCAT
uniref:Uncharacterized protein n=1 Tax=Onchocerca volvulus TaxID=6282 RepID=A0A8R1TNK4_ONCVO